MNLNNYSVTRTGKDAFEEAHEWVIVVFETEPGVFKWWNPSNYRSDLSDYNDGLPPDYDKIEEVVNDGYPMPELADQLGAAGAWGLDL